MRSPGAPPRAPPPADGGGGPSSWRLAGHIASYNSDRAYGFLKRDDPGPDVYFHRNLLPQDYQNRHGKDLVGTRVEFQFVSTKDGKDRCDRLWVMGELGGNQGNNDDGYRRRGGPGGRPPWGGSGGQQEQDTRRDRRDKHRARDDDGVPPPDLDPSYVEEMIKFLEERGGVMDYGRFSNHFAGLKKSQLEPHFTLVPEVQGKGGGRWQIMLNGVEPLTPEERAEREAQERSDEAKERNGQVGNGGLEGSDGIDGKAEDDLPALVDSEGDLFLELSQSMRLLGSIREWDRRNISGFACAEGYESVIVETAALPQDLQGRRDVDLTGCQVTFELDSRDDGQYQAHNMHVLLEPDGDGGFRFRRS